MHPDRERLSQRAFAPGVNSLFERALEGFEGTEEALESDGREAIVTYKRVPSSNWIVAAVYPKDEAFLAIRELTWHFLQLLLLASCRGRAVDLDSDALPDAPAGGPDRLT